MRIVAGLLLVASTLVLAACGSKSEATTAPAGGQAIAISESEFKLDPSTVKESEAGSHTFEVTNNGKTAHALEIEGQGVEEKTETIQPGETTELTVDLKNGSYEIYCPIDGHRQSGMEGALTVGSGGAGTGTTEEEGTSTEGGGYGYGG
jgi:plastocyanin